MDQWLQYVWAYTSDPTNDADETDPDGVPNRSSIEESSDVVFSGTIEPALSDHVATTFEAVCREGIRESIRRSDLEPYSEVGQWWYGKHEIDIVCLAPDDDRILLAECKWTTDSVGYGLVEALRTKTEHVR